MLRCNDREIGQQELASSVDMAVCVCLNGSAVVVLSPGPFAG
jgi:hypothetical protein